MPPAAGERGWGVAVPVTSAVRTKAHQSHEPCGESPAVPWAPVITPAKGSCLINTYIK